MCYATAGTTYSFFDPVLGPHLQSVRFFNNNNGNFICVFECTIVNLATYRQFTNPA